MDSGGRCGRECTEEAAVVVAAWPSACTALTVVMLGNVVLSSDGWDTGIDAPSLSGWLLRDVGAPSLHG